MTRFVLACVLSMGCGFGGSGSTAPEPTTSWLSGLKPWYCGAEALPPKVGKDGAATPQVRDVALKIVPGSESFTAIYAAANGNDKSVGSLTRFTGTGERTATMRWENDQKQKGQALLAFSPDLSTVTVTWTAEVTPPGSSPVPPAPTTLTAAPGPAACVAGGMIR